MNIKEAWEENKWIIALFGAIGAMFMTASASYIQWQLKEITKDELSGLQYVTPDQFEALKSALQKGQERNQEDIKDLKVNDQRFDSKIDRIVEILLEE